VLRIEDDRPSGARHERESDGLRAQEAVNVCIGEVLPEPAHLEPERRQDARP
jgi:hypothetical protein